LELLLFQVHFFFEQHAKVQPLGKTKKGEGENVSNKKERVNFFKAEQVNEKAGGGCDQNEEHKNLVANCFGDGSNLGVVGKSSFVAILDHHENAIERIFGCEVGEEGFSLVAI
jgi:hypothetical protein